MQRQLGHARDAVLGTDFVRPAEATGGRMSGPLVPDEPRRTEFGLLPVTLSMEGDLLVVNSFTWREAN